MLPVHAQTPDGLAHRVFDRVFRRYRGRKFGSPGTLDNHWCVWVISRLGRRRRHGDELLKMHHRAEAAAKLGDGLGTCARHIGCADEHHEQPISAGLVVVFEPSSELTPRRRADD
jgi:hypothetical protein